MKIIYRCVVTVLAVCFTSISIADVGNGQLEENPLLPKNKDVADFGVLIAATSLSYVKSVKRKGGSTIVDVVVLDKLCHVTVDESSEKLQAKAIECDAGRHVKSET